MAERVTFPSANASEIFKAKRVGGPTPRGLTRTALTATADLLRLPREP